MIYDVAIVGGGASGLMCANFLAQNKNLKIAIIEKNSTVAKKIKASGGGKCNITNISVSSDNYLGDKSLIESTLGSFSDSDLLNFLHLRGLKPVIKKGRFYFCPRSSDEIITLLYSGAKGVTIYLNHDVLEIKEGFKIITNKGEINAKIVVIASGGESYKELGASDISQRIAKSFDIATRAFEPALVGLTLQKDDFYLKELSGVSVRVSIRVREKIIKEDLLFTHRGISGPAVLTASLYWQKGAIEIDFLDGFELNQIFKSKKFISTVLPLPRSFIKKYLEHFGISDKIPSQLNKDEIEIVKRLKNYTLAPAGNFGFKKAEVSRGGVLSSELENSFEAKKIKNLYFIGEAVDVTGELGGYNFQWAFSSGVVCARNILDSLKTNS